MRIWNLIIAAISLYCLSQLAEAGKSSWRQHKIIKSIATSKPDDITFALAQYFPFMARYLAVEEMTTPGDLTLLTLDGTVAYYLWDGSKPCESAGGQGKVLTKSGVTYIKNGQAWHLSLISKELSDDQCRHLPLEEFTMKKLRSGQ